MADILPDRIWNSLKKINHFYKHFKNTIGSDRYRICLVPFKIHWKKWKADIAKSFENGRYELPYIHYDIST